MKQVAWLVSLLVIPMELSKNIHHKCTLKTYQQEMKKRKETRKK
jgi:hypothetical protein